VRVRIDIRRAYLYAEFFRANMFCAGLQPEDGVREAGTREDRNAEALRHGKRKSVLFTRISDRQK